MTIEVHPHPHGMVNATQKRKTESDAEFAARNREHWDAILDQRVLIVSR